ncbi:MAG: hypothetical protein ACRC11_06500 [Xenococcaceae cyanobacterium]
MNKQFLNSKIALAVSILGLSLVGQLLNVGNAQAGTPLTSQERFEGKVDYVVTGGSFRQESDSGNACALKTSSTEALPNLPNGATVKKAYLYWAGSGATFDSTVNLNGNSLNADKSYQETSTIDPSALFFQGVKDVTDIVKATTNNQYTLSSLTVTNNGIYCDRKVVLSAWSLLVVYEDPNIQKLNTINLYEGFKSSRYSSFDYTLDGIKVSNQPKAKYSVLAWEGDKSLESSSTHPESLQFNGQILSDTYNPANNLFNSSINSIGKGADTTYGIDFDTFDVSDKVTAGQTSIAGIVKTGQDVVLQGAAVIMVTDDLATANAPSQTVAVD